MRNKILKRKIRNFIRESRKKTLQENLKLLNEQDLETTVPNKGDDMPASLGGEDRKWDGYKEPDDELDKDKGDYDQPINPADALQLVRTPLPAIWRVKQILDENPELNWINYNKDEATCPERSTISIFKRIGKDKLKKKKSKQINYPKKR